MSASPDTAGRRRILAIHTASMPLADDVDLETIAQRTERFTGADLEDLVRRAGLTALRRGLDAAKVTMADFEVALSETRASVTPEMLEEYERIQETLKSEATRPLGGIGFVLPGHAAARRRAESPRRRARRGRPAARPTSSSAKAANGRSWCQP